MASPLAQVNDPVITTLTGAAIVVYLQRYMHTREWYQKIITALPVADKYLHRTVAALGSLLVMLGITWTFTGSWDAGWHVTIDTPAGTALLLGIWAWFKTYVLQQIVYDATKDKGGTVQVASLSTTIVPSTPPAGGSHASP